MQYLLSFSTGVRLDSSLLYHPWSREISPQTPASCRFSKSLALAERWDFEHGVRKCSFSGKYAGIFGKGTFSKVRRSQSFTSAWKNLWLDGFSGCKPPSSKQVRISGLKQCGAFTLSYEGSNTHVKESPKWGNKPKKTHKDAGDKLVLFILPKECWNFVLPNVWNRRYFIPHTKSLKL